MLPIIFISFLNTFCFILPSDGGERITFCISLFLTLAVFMTIVNGSFPESSDEVSKFGVYIGLQLIGCGLTTIATVLSLYCYHESNNTPVRSSVQLFVMAMCVSKRYRIHPHNAHNKVNANKNDGHTKIVSIASIDDSGASIASIDDSGKRDSSLPNGNETIQPLPQVTWTMVSFALDRFCFMASIVWHVVLLSVLYAVLVQ
ncbi:hypothetical protein DPMN_037364 [Dreissena polymorpha]|uniref:Neurotransmitter-gated ion-channel transmembrane domain-containing protein n=1 Tax=Dreissena polymorpha TaxID=45954 RepID=A0A9D4RP20_DREPO|nr:hypothetical protein DPMN_037364 [Dreissena polymorpha]